MYNNLCMNSAIIMFWLGLSAESEEAPDEMFPL